MLNLLIHKASVLRPTVTANEYGGAEYKYNPLLTNISCLIQPKTVIETEESGKITVRKFYRMYCDYNANTSQIKMDDLIKKDGLQYEIISIVDAAGQGRLLQIDLRRKE